MYYYHYWNIYQSVLYSTPFILYNTNLELYIYSQIFTTLINYGLLHINYFIKPNLFVVCTNE